MKKFRITIITGIIFANICTNCFAYEQSVYIWQRNWNSEVESAIASIQDATSCFTVLCGDMKFDGDKPVITPVSIEWNYFTDTNTRITVAFRINAKAAKLLATDAIYTLVDSASSLISKAINTASKNTVIGIQVDYDCPTSKLKDYAKFIKLLKGKFPDLQLSFTALPTWLDSEEFPALAAGGDYYVLQVHSFKVPDTLEEALRPFSQDAVYSWVKKASLIGRPFYLSLPTYGYEVSFNESGKFLGLRAETPPIKYKPGTKHAIVMSDPERILAFTRKINNEKTDNLLGICWFRLPLGTDEFNWSIDTLKMLMSSKSPGALLESEIISPSPGLYEIYLKNNGQTNIYKDIQLIVTWDKNEQIMHDIVSGYKEEDMSDGHGLKIVGMPPKAGSKELIAWFRTGNLNMNPLKVGEVEGYEK